MRDGFCIGPDADENGRSPPDGGANWRSFTVSLATITAEFFGVIYGTLRAQATAGPIKRRCSFCRIHSRGNVPLVPCRPTGERDAVPTWYSGKRFPTGVCCNYSEKVADTRKDTMSETRSYERMTKYAKCQHS